MAVVSYEVPTGTVGSQNFGGSLGMDFNVAFTTTITELGVFDSGSNGLSSTITAYIYDRTNTAAPLATLTFSPGDPGTLVGGTRFKTLGAPLVLPKNFQGTIVADGFNGVDLNGNLAVPPWTVNTGNGVLGFVGSSRFGTAGLFPATADGGPVNRYAAGSFVFAGAPDITSGNIPLGGITAAATGSQGGFPVSAAVDGNATPSVGGTGWAGAIPTGDNTPPATAVFEAIGDVKTSSQTQLTFNIISGGFGNHTLGRFRLSVTGDDRSLFADGLANNGDVLANWVELTPASASSSNASTVLTVLGDNSILASGGVANVETYNITAFSSLPTITGFRIELLEDPSFVNNGPGRASNGNWVLLEFQVSHVPVPEPASIMMVLLSGAALLKRRRQAA
ncbi:MAG: PEP-CTERM sorting domain-containing protein [Phycisphaeraceae bacterium]